NIAPHSGDLGIWHHVTFRRAGLATPPDDTKRRRDREQSDNQECRHLAPESMVADIVFPALEAIYDPARADEDHSAGDTAICAIETAKQRKVAARKAGLEQHELREQYAGQREDEQMMRDGEQEIGHVHFLRFRRPTRRPDFISAARR